jgi:hypothetical protein
VSDRRDPLDVAREEQDVLEIVRSSATFGRLAAMLSIVSRAAETSVVVGAVGAAHARWTEASPRHRARAAGVGLLSASLVYIVINGAFGHTVGRFWLAIPLAAALGGMVLLIASLRRQAPGHTL